MYLFRRWQLHRLVSKCSEKDVIFGLKFTCIWRCQDIYRPRSSSDPLSTNTAQFELLVVAFSESELDSEHHRQAEENCAAENVSWHNKYLSGKGESEETDRSGSVIIVLS